MSTPAAMPEGRGGGRGLDALVRRQVQQLAQGRLARRPEQDRAPQHAQRGRGRPAGRRCGPASCRTRSPGSTMRWSHGTPASSARSSARCRSAMTSADAGSGSGPRRGCASGRSGRRRSAATRTMAGSSATPQTSLSEVGAGVDGRGGHGRAGGVDRDHRAGQLRGDGPDHRHDARDLLGRADGRVAGPARGAADVEQVGAVGDHPPRLGDRRRHGVRAPRAGRRPRSCRG